MTALATRTAQVGGTRSEVLRRDRDRFLAFAFSAADILVELAPQLQLELAEPPPEAAPDDADEGGLGDDPTYRMLLNALDFSPVSIGDLGARVQLTPAELSSMLLILELEGLVEALPGGRYARLGKRKK